MEKKKVTAYVAGQKFTIVTELEEKYVLDLCAKVDAHITSLTAGHNMSREKASVLTALDFADDNESSKKELSSVKEQIKDYIATLQKHDGEMNKAQEKLDEKDSEIKALKEKIDELEDKLKTVKKNAEAAKKAAAEKDGIPREAIAEEKTEKLIDAASITANEDDEMLKNDLPFDSFSPKKEAPKAQKQPVSPPIKRETFQEPKPKKKHDHSHVNPFKEQFLQKNKGYQPQRQYSLFDHDDE